MPPKFPHGLKKPPTDMNFFEKVIFGTLATSILAGVYQLASGPWSESETDTKQSNENHVLNQNTTDTTGKILDNHIETEQQETTTVDFGGDARR
eukprot:scaffold123542_cov53-Attheya_sp.AAC.1